MADRLPKRMRTLFPSFATRLSVPGKHLPFMVSRLKSFMAMGSGRRAPGSIFHSDSRMAKSRSGRSAWDTPRGWTTMSPIMPMAIWVISSWWGWYMRVPLWRKVHS